MTEFKLKSEAALRAQDDLDKATDEYNRKMYELTLKCKHHLCYATPYVWNTYLNLEEMRTCLECGLTEIKHSTFGYRAVRSEFSREIDRDTLYKLRRGQLNASHQEALYDKEKSLEDVLMELYPHVKVAEQAVA
jgi:ferredoxin-like protein FixX